MRILVALGLCMPLAGCFSLTASKPIPDWAMSPQAQNIAEPVAQPRHVAARSQAKRIAARPARRSLTGMPIEERPAGLSSGGREDAARIVQPGVKAFSPEWQAREDARDATLRRSMNICSRC